MPQMSPMNWTFIFIFMLMFMLLSISNMNPLVTKTLNKQNITKKENSMKW